jgi:hypothetical protein
MNTMIAWGVANGAQPLSSEEHEIVKEALDGEDWLLVFQGVAVITIADDAARLALQQKLVQVSQSKLNSRMLFLMSPITAPGSGIYRGFIPQPIWDPLNSKTV